MSMTAALPVLTFHDLADCSAPISLSPQVFHDGMARLHNSGYRTLDLLQAVAGLRQGKPFPARAFVLTFDDGYESVYREAFPVLQRYGMSATVFLTVGEKKMTEMRGQLPPLNRRSMLSWTEIREMQRWGIVFGAHTLTHPDLTLLPVEQIEAEVCGSKKIIEDTLGAAVPCFAYPYGRHDRRSRAIARQHFACACSDKLGLVTVGSDPYALERVETYYLRTGKLFEVMTTRLFPWYIRARKIPRTLRRAARGLLP